MGNDGILIGRRARVRGGWMAAVLVTTLVAVLAPSAAPVAGAATPRSGRAVGPSITVTPSTKLADGQTVTIAGTGFIPGSRILVGQCVGTSSDPLCDSSSGSISLTFLLLGGGDLESEPTADRAGHFSTTLIVSRFVSTSTITDCATARAGCTIAAQGLGEDDIVGATQRITFDPAKPARPPVTVSLAIDHDPIAIRADGSVTVTGTLTCSEAIEAVVQVGIGEGSELGTAEGSAASKRDCGPTPTPWAEAIRSDASSFVNGTALVSAIAAISYPVSYTVTSGAVDLTGAPTPSAYLVSLGAAGESSIYGLSGTSYLPGMVSALGRRVPGLAVAAFGCDDESSSSLFGESTCNDPDGAVVDDAVALLRAHRGKVAAVTLDINDLSVALCGLFGSGDGDETADCVGSGLAQLDTDVRALVKRLRAAAGPGVPFVAKNALNPLTGFWFGDGEARDLFNGSVMVTHLVNAHLRADLASAGVTVADAAKAFRSDDLTLVDSPFGRVPRAVATACAYEVGPCGADADGDSINFEDDEGDSYSIGLLQGYTEAGAKVVADVIDRAIVLLPADRAYVQAIRHDLLAPAGTAASVAADAAKLADGTLSRAGYAKGLLSGAGWAEFTAAHAADAPASRVRTVFKALLGRNPDAAGLKYWSAQVVAKGDAVLVTGLAASREYLLRSQTRFPAA